MPSRHRRPTFLLSRSHRPPVPRLTPRPLWTGLLLCALAATAAGPLAAAPYATPETEATEPAWSEAAYTYFRVVEGTATLFPVDSVPGDEPPGDTAYEAVPPTTADEVVVHQPVLVGDRLTVNPGARLELVLSDGSLLRLQGPSEVVFEAIAGSPDTENEETVLRLTLGELQIVRLDDPTGADGLRPAVIETPDSRMFLERAGTYRVSTGVELGGTRLTVREGLAEMVTDHGSILVREGDEAVLETGVRPRVAFAAAGPEDTLERWGRRLWDEAAHTDPGPVDSSLRYSAAGLSRYGSWVHVGGQRAWRPRVEPDWRPYWSGRWVYTPSGYLWVSYEPWGWVPYHYGTWALDPGYGWVWYPGSRFAPAWVYWHWGASHVAWVPIGYYSHHYARHHYGHFSLRFGHYGFAGGLGHHFRHWLFADHHHFHHRDLHHHAYPWHRFRDRHHRDRDSRDRHRDGHDGRIRRDVVPGGRGDLVPRGIVTTDSRGFGRGEGTPRRLALRRDDLPDVSAFVAREPELSPDLERRLVTRQPERRLAGTPLAPGTRAPRSLSARRASPRTRGVTPSERTTLRDSRRLTPRSSTPEATRRGSLRPRAVTPRATTPRDRDSRATTPRRVTPRAESPGARRPARVTPRTDRPRTERPRTERREPLRPRSARPGAVQPRAERPTTVRPRATAPRSAPPRSSQPRSIEPRTRRPETSRGSAGGSGLRPRSVRPGTTPRTVRPSPSRPPSRPPTARTPSSRRPEARRPATRTPSTRRPSTRSSSPRGSGLRPRSSSGVRRSAPSTSGRTPRSGVSRSQPRGGKSTPRARSGGGSSRSGGKATSRRGGSRGKSGASPRSRSGSSRNRGGASRRGGG